jgi:hypothetical protein
VTAHAIEDKRGLENTCSCYSKNNALTGLDYLFALTRLLEGAVNFGPYAARRGTGANRVLFTIFRLTRSPGVSSKRWVPISLVEKAPTACRLPGDIVRHRLGISR